MRRGRRTASFQALRGGNPAVGRANFWTCRPVNRDIPVGAGGNPNPIIITTERWYSPDLQLTVLQTHSDPRFGTSTFQLTNIVRSEPDQTVFAVPSDYTLQ